MLRTLDADQTSPGEDQLRVILRDFDERLTTEQRERLSTDDLYDEHGLPA